MNQTVPGITFRRLVNELQRPATPARSEPYWPYPLPPAEMVARYGLRCLTAEEKQVFPGLPLALDVFKARVTKPPATVPLARAGWIVWLAETYPGCYLVRLPGGATLPAPYNEMSWTAPSACPTPLGRSELALNAVKWQAVADDEPVTTLATAKAMEQYLHWQTAVLRRLRQTLQL